jgi:predicted dehydrogenase
VTRTSCREKLGNMNGPSIRRTSAVGSKKRRNARDARLQQSSPRPASLRPIVILGAGGIVRAGHLPAYQASGFEIAGIFDIRPETAQATAREFRIARVFTSLDEALAAPDVVFDLAVPAEHILPVLRRVPRGAAILIQKPMGQTLSEARAIVRVVRAKKLLAAVNFQLRFSPNVLALRDLLARRSLGHIRDVEVRVVADTPWSAWKFLRGIPRLELLYHSIHYLDLLRALFGEPDGVIGSARTDPAFPGLADTRCALELVYARGPRVTLRTNHAHEFGPVRRVSEIRVEGSRGAALLRMGVNLDYPSGKPDTLEIARDREWKYVPLRGSWFPEAFEGPMSNLQRHVAGEDRVLQTSVADALRTMALVEACYTASKRAPTRVPRT